MIETNTPDPDALENIFDNATADSAASASADRRAILQAENEIAKKYYVKELYSADKRNTT